MSKSMKRVVALRERALELGWEIEEEIAEPEVPATYGYEAVLATIRMKISGGDDEGGPVSIEALFVEVGMERDYLFSSALISSPRRQGRRRDTHALSKLYQWLKVYAPKGAK